MDGENMSSLPFQSLPNSHPELLRNFFVFQPSQFNLLRQYPNGRIRSKKQSLPFVRKSPQKNTFNFPAGFQMFPRTQDNHQSIREDEMILRPQKNPRMQVSSYLLEKKKTSVYEVESPTSESQVKHGTRGGSMEHAIERKEESIQAFINNLKQRKKHESTTKIIRPENQEKNENTNNKSNACLQSNSAMTVTQLPQLQKKTSIAENISTPKLQYQTQQSHSSVLNKQVAQSKPQIKINPEVISHKSSKTSISTKNNLSQKKMILPKKYYSAKIFQGSLNHSSKGYIAYHADLEEFLNENRQNLFVRLPNSKPISNISASNYIVVDQRSLTLIADRRSDEWIEVASLSKIMTCYLCILACRRYMIDMKTFWIRVSDRAAEMPGTSADLQAGDLITLHDLLYGLMLPSGNDASVAIAQTVGRIIQKSKKKPPKKTNYDVFITHMNLLAKQLHLQQEFRNPSGLPCNPNYATPKSIALLAIIALRNPLFAKIVSVKSYEIEIMNERFGLARKQVWKNTNKLLSKGWDGVKTGTTDTAGHCLMAAKDGVMVGVFDCESLGKRFSESVKIYESLQLNDS